MNKKKAFLSGLRDGVPIGLGYFAVSFSLGIMAKKGGLTPVIGFISSFLTRASAGEYGVYSLILSDATYVEILVISLITNLRYLLMSTALSQKFSPETSIFKRILVGCCVTDEVFGISIAYKGYLEPLYTFGAFAVSSPMWAAGTAMGIIAGSILPTRAVSALSVALYGMFLAIIIPPSKKDKAVLVSVIISFVLSFIWTDPFLWIKGHATGFMSKLMGVSAGTRTIILTIIIAAVVALIRPVPNAPDETDD